MNITIKDLFKNQLEIMDKINEIIDKIEPKMKIEYGYCNQPDEQQDWQPCQSDEAKITAKRNINMYKLSEFVNEEYKPEPTDWQKDIEDARGISSASIIFSREGDTYYRGNWNKYVEKFQCYESAIEKMAKVIEKLNRQILNQAGTISELKQQQLKKREIPKEVIEWLKYNASHIKIGHQTCNKCCNVTQQLLKILEADK